MQEVQPEQTWSDQLHSATHGHGLDVSREICAWRCGDVGAGWPSAVRRGCSRSDIIEPVTAAESPRGGLLLSAVKESRERERAVPRDTCASGVGAMRGSARTLSPRTTVHVAPVAAVRGRDRRAFGARGAVARVPLALRVPRGDVGRAPDRALGHLHQDLGLVVARAHVGHAQLGLRVANHAKGSERQHGCTRWDPALAKVGNLCSSSSLQICWPCFRSV